MAKAGAMPRSFARAHPDSGTPIRAIAPLAISLGVALCATGLTAGWLMRAQR